MRNTSPTALDDARQEAGALRRNAEYFADNDYYKSAQKRLEIYYFIGLAASHETAQAKALLDIGNGGVFEYPIAHIPRVVAIDVFVEESFAKRYPQVEWRQLSALDMEFDERFDTVIALNTLHHIIGSSVETTYTNLYVFMRRAMASLEGGGKLVLIESTMPRWFVWLYGRIFPYLLKVWPLTHPPTFQFYYRDILRAADSMGFELREFTWIPKTSDFLMMGWQVKRWMAPIRVGKFVFTTPRSVGEWEGDSMKPRR